MMRKVLFLFIIPLVLYSCKATQKAGDGAKADLNKRTEQLIDSINKHEMSPKTISFKSAVDVKSKNKKNSVKMNCRIQVDSVIWISFTAYGYEVARALARPDSLFFVNKTKKEYFSGEYSFLEQKLDLDIDFNQLQSILLGNAIDIDAPNIKRSNDKDLYLLSTLKKRKLKKAREKSHRIDDDIVVSNWINPSNYRLSKLQILDLRNKRSALIDYQDFKEIDNFVLATESTITIKSKQKLTIENQYSRININDEERFPFKIYDSYTPIR